MVLTLAANVYVQRQMIHQKISSTSEGLFWQVDQLIQSNERILAEARSDFSEGCLGRAKTAAYILELRPEMRGDMQALRDLARLLDVDELHLFTPEGEVVSGTHPEYYHYTFSTGEQMRFFLPMLEDRSLELCQDIMPNTAEGKLMQYAAVWSGDGSTIVQIGMVPERVQKVMDGRTLASVFALMPMQRSTAIHAVDADTGEILASTAEDCVGLNAQACGFSLDQAGEQISMTHAVVHEEKYCVNMRRMDSMILIRTFRSAQLYQEVWMNTAFLAVYLVLTSLIALFVILTYIERKLVREIGTINRDLQRIADGEQDGLSRDGAVPELEELCGYINDMLWMVQASARKISIALERSHMPIGICEYAGRAGKGFVTSKVRDILLLEGTDVSGETDVETAARRIESLKRQGPAEGNIYELRDTAESCFIRLEEFDYEQSHIVILVDVTRERREQARILYQRDVDELTELYNRRGFYARMDRLMQHPETLGFGAVALIDADGLKAANDTYGHQHGDLYLCGIAEILRSFPAGHIVSARLGGDEFVVFFHGYGEETALRRAVRELVEKSGVRAIEDDDGEKIYVQYSVGWAAYPQEGGDYHALLRIADERMYENKRLRKLGDAGGEQGQVH